MKKDIFNSIKVVVFALLVGLGVGYAFAGYTPPTSMPTGANTAPPVNVGTVTQSKNGVLGVNGLGVFGNSNMFGDVYIGPASTLPDPTTFDPSAADKSGMLSLPGSTLAMNSVKGASWFSGLFSKITGLFDFTANTAFATQPEGPIGNAMCSDGKDNDGDTLIDSTDPGCQPGGWIIDPEGPPGDISCFDGIDNDFVDGVDAGDYKCVSAPTPVASVDYLYFDPDDNYGLLPAGASLGAVDGYFTTATLGPNQVIPLMWAFSPSNASCTATSPYNWNGTVSASDGGKVIGPVTASGTIKLSCTSGGVTDTQSINVVYVPTPVIVPPHYILVVNGNELVKKDLKVTGNITSGTLKGGNLCADAAGKFMICAAVNTPAPAQTMWTLANGQNRNVTASQIDVNKADITNGSNTASSTKPTGTSTSGEVVISDSMFIKGSVWADNVYTNKFDGTSATLSGNMSVGGNISIKGNASGVAKIQKQTTSSGAWKPTDTSIYHCSGVDDLGQLTFVYSGPSSSGQYGGRLSVCINDNGYRWVPAIY